MTVTIRRYRRKSGNFYQPDYNSAEQKEITCVTAAECMSKVAGYRMENNVSVYTPYEIVNVED